MRTHTAALALAFGALALTACAAPKPASTTPAGTDISATPTDEQAELDFLKTSTEIARRCTPDAPATTTPSDAPPRPEDLVASDPAAATTQPGGGTPTEGAPLPVDESEGTPDAPLATGPVNEVPLPGIESCAGDEHTKAITAAFKGKGAASDGELKDLLTGAGYPAHRIHPMPEHSGSPRARLDLRTMGSHLVLEITATASGAVVEKFGAPEGEEIDVTTVQRKPALGAPTR
jgi:hypothetical protein